LGLSVARESTRHDTVNARAFGFDDLLGQDDPGPEGATFSAAEDSPNGRPLLLVGNEVSQTLTVLEVEALMRDGAGLAALPAPLHSAISNTLRAL
jgi:hypothetical protein